MQFSRNDALSEILNSGANCSPIHSAVQSVNMVICVAEAHAAGPQQCNLTQGFVCEAKHTELSIAHEREKCDPD